MVISFIVTYVRKNSVFHVEALNNHLKTGCQGGPKLQKPQANKTCVTCNYTFTRVAALNNHLKTRCQAGPILFIF